VVLESTRAEAVGQGLKDAVEGWGPMRPLAVAGLGVLGLAAVLMLVSATYGAAESGAESRCDADPDCYVAGVGEAILAVRFGVAAAVAAVVGLVLLALAWVVPRREAQGACGPDLV
jgi:hypothetical protein